MSQVYKQMIVMLMSIAFIGIVAVIVLSSSAAASSVPIDTDMYDYEDPEYNPDKEFINRFVVLMFIGLIILIFTYNPTVPASDPNDCLNDEPIAETEDELEPDDDDDIDDGWIYDDERNMWIDPCDQDDPIPEYDRRAAQAEIEREWK